MKQRKALPVPEEEVLETKSAKRVRELLKHVSRLCTGKSKTKHVISINTYHLACAEGSALQLLFIIVPVNPLYPNDDYSRHEYKYR